MTKTIMTVFETRCTCVSKSSHLLIIHIYAKL